MRKKSGSSHAILSDSSTLHVFSRLANVFIVSASFKRSSRLRNFGNSGRKGSREFVKGAVSSRSCEKFWQNFFVNLEAHIGPISRQRIFGSGHSASKLMISWHVFEVTSLAFPASWRCSKTSWFWVMRVRNVDKPSMLSSKLDFFSTSQPLTLPVLISTKSRPFLILCSNHSKGTRILLRFRNRRHSIVCMVIEGLGKGERSKTFFSAQNLLTARWKYLQEASRLPVCGHKKTRIGSRRSCWTLSSRTGAELLDVNEEEISISTGVSRAYSRRCVRMSILSLPLFLFLPPFLTPG
mmetsp:Transcript_33030/g.46103  ORF Transcript_33030/g.46103 Transcript_33030/m.46103 type:complete len:295 (+) Transcript_33030:854-1738(+)